jgi:hypothetical protein
LHFRTIPTGPRTDTAKKATDEVVTFGLFYGLLPTAVGSRMVNVGVGGEKAEPIWNVADWDLK